jgi:hypothetical protein
MMKRATLTFHRYLDDEPIRLARIVGRELDGQGRALTRFRYAPNEDGLPDDRYIKPGFSRALRHGPHTFLCAPGLYHNVNSRARRLEKDKSREYTLIYELTHEPFARRRPSDRYQALDAARLLNDKLSPLDVLQRLFPDHIPGADD